MGASIKQTVIASDEEAQYDEKAKKLLGHKIILAYILVNTIDEFRGMNPKDVVKYIEGEPHINVVPIDPGVTNTSEKTETESIKDRKIPYICGLRARIECEPLSEHSTRSDRVTNIGLLLSLGAFTLPAANQELFILICKVIIYAF